MTNFRIKLIARKQVAKNTMAFVFEKPKNFTYKPGQYISINLIESTSEPIESRTHCFSLASDPDENELMIATRIRETTFKQFLSKLKIGHEVEINGPMGSFTLHEDPSIPAVYLTGGIGITPVRSILKYATREKLPHTLFLFYSNAAPETSAFLPELVMMNLENPHFHFIGTMSRIKGDAQQEWPGEKGQITEQMLEKYIGDLKKPIYYISGSTKLVSAMKKMLVNAGIASEHIHTEEFSGY